MRHNSSALLFAALIIGALLRALRVCARWDELTLAYAAYMAPLVKALEEGHPTALLGSWTGLHPPMYGILHAVLEVVWPVPLVWLVFSALTSLGAVALVGRTAGPFAALVLATAPVHLLDAAEINNYPLTSLAVAFLIFAARRSWPWLAAGAVFASWCHILGGLAAVGVITWRLWKGPSVKTWPLVGASLLGMLPVAGGALRLMGMGSTWSQPDVDLVAWGQLIVDSMGWEGLVLAPVVLIGLRKELAAGWLAMAGALVLAIALGAAAAHQRPYLSLLAPIAAVAVGRVVSQRPRLVWLVVALCLVRAVRFSQEETSRLSVVLGDQLRVRAVDSAIEQSRPGDTLWLVAPALQADDDKSDTGPVMWRLRPWESMPMTRPVKLEYKDYRYGHPRLWRERTVHTSTELDPAAFDHIAAHRLEAGGRLWVVLYDHGPAHGLKVRVERALRPYVTERVQVGTDTGLGVDWLFKVEGRR